jgi:hypothetical protein
MELQYQSIVLLNLYMLFINSPLAYHLEINKVYDTTWKLVAQIEGDRIYSEDWSLLYRIESDRINDSNWRLVYSVEDR